MGIHRGDFESASLTSQAPAAVQHATSRPDIGAGLKALAPGLRRWGDVMGKLSDMGDSYTMRKNKAEAQKAVTAGRLAKATDEYNNATKAVAECEANLSQEGLSDADRKQYESDLRILKTRQEQWRKNAKDAQQQADYADDVWNRTGFFGSVGTPSAETHEASRGIHWYTQMFKPPIRVEDNMK